MDVIKVMRFSVAYKDDKLASAANTRKMDMEEDVRDDLRWFITDLNIKDAEESSAYKIYWAGNEGWFGKDIALKVMKEINEAIHVLSQQDDEYTDASKTIARLRKFSMMWRRIVIESFDK